MSKTATKTKPTKPTKPAEKTGEKTPQHPPEQATSIPGRVYIDVGGFDLKVEQVSPSEDNPRKFFDPVDLENLATSLRSHGQLQNITVRAKEQTDVFYPASTYEIISGERRYRAAKLADLTMLVCRVIVCDDITAIELRGIENYRRRDFNAVEEAIWFKQLIETGKYNQATLAKWLEIDPSQVSNRLRLLDLPDEWQEKVIHNQLPPTHARYLVPWVNRPQILKAIEEHLKSGSADSVTVATFETWILTAAIGLSRSLDPDSWEGPSFDLTDELIKSLDPVDVHEFHGSTGKKPRAFNTELWDRLERKAIAAKRNRDAGKIGDGDDGSEASSPLAPATAPLDGDGPGIDDDDLVRHFTSVFRESISRNLNPDAAIRILLASMVGAQDADYLAQSLVSRLETELNEYPTDVEVYRSVMGLTAKKFNGLVVPLIQQYLSNELNASIGFALDFLILVAEDIGINPVSMWRPSRELLELCKTDELRQLFTADMGAKKLAKMPRKMLIEELLSHWPTGYLPELLTPDDLNKDRSGSDSDADDSDD